MNYENLRTFDKLIHIDFELEESKGEEKLNKTHITDEIFIIDNVLKNNECDDLVKKTKQHYANMSREYPSDIRGNNRVLVISEKLKETINGRIMDVVNFPDNVKPCGFGTDGKWKYLNVNECFRFSEYVSPNVGFLPHRDATYIKDENNRSIYTIIIYLNEEYDGGNTYFCEPKRDRIKGETVNEELSEGHETFFTYKPKKCSALIFNHNIVHAGDTVVSGTKYILRSDLVFTRTEFPDNYNYDWKKSPDFIQAVKYYREAFNQELEGNIEKASEMFERGLSYRQMQ
jgi:hypothetical protein